MTLPIVASATLVIAALSAAIPTAGVRRLRWSLPAVFVVGAVFGSGTWQRVALIVLAAVTAVALFARERAQDSW